VTDPLFDADGQPPTDSEVPDGRDQLPDSFWTRPVRTVSDPQERL
jgi:hypothetical protein